METGQPPFPSASTVPSLAPITTADASVSACSFGGVARIDGRYRLFYQTLAVKPAAIRLRR